MTKLACTYKVWFICPRQNPPDKKRIPMVANHVWNRCWAIHFELIRQHYSSWSCRRHYLCFISATLYPAIPKAMALTDKITMTAKTNIQHVRKFEVIKHHQFFPRMVNTRSSTVEWPASCGSKTFTASLPLSTAASMLHTSAVVWVWAPAKNRVGYSRLCCGRYFGCGSSSPIGLRRCYFRKTPIHAKRWCFTMENLASFTAVSLFDQFIEGMTLF